MAIDRSRRITFEEVAELYDEVCSTYPEPLVDDVIALSGIPPGGRILEIGCGPGNATIPFLRRGYSVVAIELGARLAALAASNCRAYPAFEVHNVAFEEWQLEEKAFDLALSADAFHWIPPEVGYPRVAAALKDSGSAAFFWSVPVDPQTDWSRAIDDVYQDLAPGVENPGKRFTAEWVIGVIRGNLAASNCFGEVTVKQHAWSEVYTTDRYVNSLRTYSGHRGMDEATRSRLFAGIREVIDQAGGSVVQPNLVVLFHAVVSREYPWQESNLRHMV